MEARLAFACGTDAMYHSPGFLLSWLAQRAFILDALYPVLVLTVRGGCLRNVWIRSIFFCRVDFGMADSELGSTPGIGSNRW